MKVMTDLILSRACSRATWSGDTLSVCFKMSVEESNTLISCNHYCVVNILDYNSNFNMCVCVCVAEHVILATDKETHGW